MALIKNFPCLKETLSLVLIMLGLTLSTNTLSAQLEVTNSAPITPENLISNVFLGDGVDVISITYEGSSRAVGLFTNGEDDIGISRGIVMTTGFAVTQGGQNGANAPGTSDASVEINSSANDMDLASISGNGIGDVSKYIIQFIPTNDTLQFTYSFASEEYPNYVCSEYNDVFGFFISGPGINGPYQNGAENIALIPGTDRPVTINNVNSGAVGGSGTIQNCTGTAGSLAFSQFYNNNQSNSFPVYNGYTDVFVAQAIVMPCSLYTIKLVIADASDGALDSGVFLEAKSFGTGSLDVEITGLAVDGGMAEGCNEGEIVFRLPAPVESDYDVLFEVGGTAIPDVDYPALPTNIIIPVGDSTFTITLSAIEDGLVEGNEYIELSVQRDPCNRDTFLIIIRDNILIDPDLGEDHIICPMDSTQLDGTVSIPLPEPPHFENNTPLVIDVANEPFISEIEVTGVLPLILDESTIVSICIDSFEHRWIDDIDIFLVTPGGQFMELTTDNGRDGGNGGGFDYYIGTCFTVDATVPVNFPGPDALPESLPLTGNWLPEGVWSDLWDGNNPTNGTWQLVITDDSNGFTGTLFSWSITFNAAYQIGYSWSSSEGLSCTDCPDPITFPDVSTTYIMTATDSYGCQTQDSVYFEVLPTLTMSELVCTGSTDTTVTVSWPEVIDANAYEVSINGGAWMPSSDALSHIAMGFLPSEDIEIRVRALGECPNLSINTIVCRTLGCTPTNLSATTSDVTCFGGTDGSTQVNIESGIGPFSYQLDDEMNNIGLFSNLSAGTYTINITDANNCLTILESTVNEPTQLSIQSNFSNVDCFGAANGSINVQGEGGTLPYTFIWNNASTQNQQTGLTAGIYAVTMTDAFGCEETEMLAISQPDGIVATLSSNDISCFGKRDGVAKIDASGGTPPYRYRHNQDGFWKSNTTFIGLFAGDYLFEIKDAEGCIQVLGTVSIVEPPLIEIDLGGDRVIRFGDTIDVIPHITGGNPIQFYEWLHYDSTWMACQFCEEQTVFPQHQRDLFLSVEDESGCMAEEWIRIRIEKDFPILVATGFTPNGDQINDKLIVHGLPGSTIVSFQVWDRWGEMVYEQGNFDINDPGSGWDGLFRNEPMTGGVYLWKIEALLPDGKKQVLAGQTTLIR